MNQHEWLTLWIGAETDRQAAIGHVAGREPCQGSGCSWPASRFRGGLHQQLRSKRTGGIGEIDIEIGYSQTPENGIIPGTKVLDQIGDRLRILHASRWHTGKDRILPGSGNDRVRTATGIQDVAPLVRLQGIVARTALDERIGRDRGDVEVCRIEIDILVIDARDRSSEGCTRGVGRQA